MRKKFGLIFTIIFIVIITACSAKVDTTLDCKEGTIEKNGYCVVDSSNIKTEDPTEETTEDTTVDARDDTTEETSEELSDVSNPVLANKPQSQRITIGDSLDLLSLGLTAFDDVDGDLTSNITVDVLDTTTLKVGAHYVTYSVSDESGNVEEITIELIVDPQMKTLGDTIEIDDLLIFIKSTEVQEIDNVFVDADYAVLIEVEIKNLSDETHSLNMFYDSCFDPLGLETDSVDFYFDSSITMLGSMRPNAVMIGYLTFEYTQDGDYVLELDEWFEDEIQIKVPVTLDSKQETTEISNFTPYVATEDYNMFMYELGDTLQFDNFEIFIKSTEVQEIDNMFADMDYAVLIEVEMRNISNEASGFNFLYDSAFGNDGLELSGADAYFDNSLLMIGSIRPGAVVTGHFIYEYTGDGEYIIEFSDFLSSDLIKVPVKFGTKYSTDETSNFPAYDSSLDVNDNMFAMGDTITFDDLEIIFTNVTVSEVDSYFASIDKVIVIGVEIKNISRESHGLNMFYHNCYGPDGLKTPDTNLYFDNVVESEDMLPGATLQGYLTYEYQGDGSYIVSFATLLSDAIEFKFNVVEQTQ